MGDILLYFFNNFPNYFRIVLDMDETLGHFIFNEIKNKFFSNYGCLISDDKNNFNKNSENKDKLKVVLFLVGLFVKYFLEEINKLNYEIVIFTAGQKSIVQIFRYFRYKLLIDKI